MLLALLERYSDAALLLGERQLFLSLLGFVAVLSLSWCWRHHSSTSRLSVWLFFLLWLVWGSLLFTPEHLHPWQASLRQSFNLITSDDIFSFCSQSASYRHLPPPVDFLPTVGWTILIIALWAALASGKYYFHWRKRQRYLRMAMNAERLDDSSTTAMLEQWRQAFRLRRALEIRSSDQCDQAFTFGVLRPVIFIPRYLLEGLQAHELHAVLGHEVAHIKRLDDLTIHLQNLLRAAFFFNPVFNFANNRIAELREHCCDRLAIEHGKLSSKQFGESLLRTLSLNMAEDQATRDLPQDTVAGLGKASLRRRIESLTHKNQHFSYWPLFSTALGLLTLSLLFGHSPSTPLTADKSSQWLASIDATAPVPNGEILSKPFQWSNACVFISEDRSRYHPGVDFATPIGQQTPVRSIAEGKVLHAFKRGAQWRVYIEHPQGIVSTYLHLDSPSVKAGDVLERGDIIAINQGKTHAYVHVEVHKNGQVLDPSYLLNASTASASSL